MNLEDLKNPELQEKLKGCETPEDIFELVKTEGIDLTEEELQAISGGYLSWLFESVSGWSSSDSE